MASTGEFDMELPVPDLAIGYQKVEGEDGRSHWENNLFKHLVRGGPGGGGFSTVDDLFNFSQALDNGTLVTPETRTLLYTEIPETGNEKNKWGYGFIIRRDPDLGKITGHSGGFFGIDSCLWMYQDTGFTVVNLSNFGDGAQSIIEDLRQCLLELNAIR